MRKGIILLLAVSVLLGFATQPWAEVPITTTTINVVCLHAGFPTSAQVTLTQIDRAGNVIGTEHAPIDTTDGFASFQVTKFKNYRVTATKQRRGFRVRDLVASRDLMNINTAAAVGLVLSPDSASASETSINIVCLFNNMPRLSRVDVRDADARGEPVPGTWGSATWRSGLALHGFVSFRVPKRRNYRVTAYDVMPETVGGVEIGGLLKEETPIKIMDLRSASVIPLYMKDTAVMELGLPLQRTENITQPAASVITTTKTRSATVSTLMR